MMTRRREQTPFGTLTTITYSDEPLTEQYIKARSQQHADRIAAAFNWWSFDHGTGRSFGQLYFNRARHRLSFRRGLDV